jgi:uncharacterized membrane protein YbhN (UPF0104 family)
LTRSVLVSWTIRVAVSVTVIVILFRIIPSRAVLDALRHISMWTWVASLGIFCGGHYLNAIKLRLLVGRPVPLSTFVQAQYAGLVANLGLPGLAGGDLARATYLVPAVTKKRVALASLADRMLDTFTLVVLIAIALLAAGVPAPIADIVSHGGRWLIWGAVIGVVLVGLILRRKGTLSSELVSFWDEIWHRRASMASAIAISFFVQSAFVLTNAILAREAGVTTGLAAWFVGWPASKLVAVLPISLGGIGVREAALVTLMAPYGAPREDVLATGILWQGVLTVSGLGGLIVTQWLRRSAANRERRTSSQGTE